jgi:heme A synthase
MPISLILACVWVLATAVVAMLPMRMQYAPGITLLILSVPLAIYVGVQVGWIWVALVVFAVLSMFRNPFVALYRYLRRRLAGET